MVFYYFLFLLFSPVLSPFDWFFFYLLFFFFSRCLFSRGLVVGILEDGFSSQAHWKFN